MKFVFSSFKSIRIMYTRNDIITEERLSELERIREQKREERFAALVPKMGEAAVDEVRKIYKMFTIDMLIWYAGLWEPEIGGFYFSNSARDHEGFLPDLESTAQAVGFITAMCGLGDDDKDTYILPWPKRFSDKISNFAYNLQDEDGYFYHPQWGKEISPTRRGRDGGWAWRLIEPLGKKCKYLRPTQRAKQEGTPPPTFPDYLQSTDALREWLSTRDIENNSYSFGNLINSTGGQFVAAGDEYVKILVDYLNSHNREDNGLWEPQVNYASVNGLMKLGMVYPGLNGATLPHPDKSFESAVAAVVSDEEVTFACQFYNAWAAAQACLKSMELEGDEEKAEKYRARLREVAPEMIRVTGEKIALTAVGDGSFAYFTAASGMTCPHSQGAWVALHGVREGDVNGNGCSTRAPLRHMFKAFGVDMPPFFTEKDAEFFFELLDARVPVPKKPNPELEKEKQEV